MFSDYFVLSLKNLKKRGIRTWLTMLGIFIGIAAVVSLISLANGLESAIVGQFGSLDKDKLTIQNSGTGFGPPGSTAIRKLTSHDVKVIESVSGVQEVIPRLIRIVKIEFNKKAGFDYIASMPANKEQLKIIYDSLNVEAEDGRLLEEDDKGKVLLGNGFTDEDVYGKKIKVGDKITIQGKDFEVVGFLEKASTFQINYIALVMEDDLKNLLDIGDEIDLIVAQVDEKNIQETAVKIEDKLRRDRHEKVGEEDFSVQTPLQAISAITTILNVVNAIVIGIAAISLLIGGIGIMNSMFTSVLERTKDIGIMKSVGAKNKDILLFFLIESALLGAIGGIVGAAIGLGFAYLVSGIASSALGGINLEVTFSPSLLLGAISFSIVIGILSGVIPAYQASKLKPVDAFRK